MFDVLKSKAHKNSVYLGAPEAEGETSASSRVSILDVYEDFHDLIPQLSSEKFIVIGRKGCGKVRLLSMSPCARELNPIFFVHL